MPKLPRRLRNAKRTASSAPPPSSSSASSRAPTSSAPAGPQRSPAEELEARLHEPDEGPFLDGLEKRVLYPTLIEKISDAGQRIIEVLSQSDSSDLFLGYESLEFEVAEVRERAAFGLGWEHGSADGRAEFLRSQAPTRNEKAKCLADQARALVVNGDLSPHEATVLLLETAWSILLMKPAPSYEG